MAQNKGPRITAIPLFVQKESLSGEHQWATFEDFVDEDSSGPLADEEWHYRYVSKPKIDQLID